MFYFRVNFFFKNTLSITYCGLMEEITDIHDDEKSFYGRDALLYHGGSQRELLKLR